MQSCAGRGTACTKHEQTQPRPVLSAQLPTRKGSTGNAGASPSPPGIKSRPPAPKSVPLFPKIPGLGVLTPCYPALLWKHWQSHSQRSIPAFPNPPSLDAFLTLSQTRGNFLLKCHKSLPGLQQQKVRKGIRGTLIQNLPFPLLQTE